MYFVYLLTSKPYGSLYIGWTTNLARRVREHKNKAVPGFTTKYGVDRLVWFENHDDREVALRREKQIKGWNRAKKVTLIKSVNPKWWDLSAGWGKPYSSEEWRAGKEPVATGVPAMKLATDSSRKERA